MNFVSKEGDNIGADPGCFHLQDYNVGLTVMEYQFEFGYSVMTRKLSTITKIQSSKSAKMRRTKDCRMPDAGPTHSGRNLSRNSPQDVDTESRFELKSSIGIWWKVLVISRSTKTFQPAALARDCWTCGMGS